MMEFWSENQRHVYSRLGTVPGRNCAHNHHNRHQMSHYPLNFGEETESSDWTRPEPRAAQPEYINWTDPTSSFHLTAILDTQHHQGGYPQPDAGVREWTTSQRAARDCERGPLREGWQQRRWEPSDPLSYSREASARRSDSNYRELEAWAARYSHSLPRRRRVEAELQGASLGLVGPQKLQHVQINPNNRIYELWDRRRRGQAPTHNTKFTQENTSYQRMAFSHPPGYVAPPSYTNPQKSSPVKPFCDTSIKQRGHPKMEKFKEELRTPDESKTRPGLQGVKHTSQDGDALQSDSPIKTRESNEGPLAPQHPQAAQNPKITSKIIEGRKFRLNKKTGGMTVFCLVSRMATPSEAPPLPVCTSRTNVQSADEREVSTGPKNRHEVGQHADEVDSEASPSTEQSPSDAKSLEAAGQETLGDEPTNEAEADDDFTTFRRHGSQTEQPASAKYPLWREPSSMTSPPHKNLEDESDEVLNLHKAGTNTDTRTADTEDREGLMVIDTSCVVVKVELIPPPKKEHVHYPASSISSETNDQTFASREPNHPNRDVSSDRTKDSTRSQINASREADASFSRAPPPPLPGTETLGERTKRILGISPHDDVVEERPDEASVSASRAEEPKDEAGPSERAPEDTAGGGEAVQTEVQTEVPEGLKHSEEIGNQFTNEAGRGFTETREEFADLSEDDDPDNKTSAETMKNALPETTSEKDQRRDETLPVNESTQLPDLCNSALFSPFEPALLLNTSEEGLDSQQVPHSPDANLPPRPSTSFPLLQLSSLPSETADDSLKSSPCTLDRLPRTPPAEHEGKEDETSHLTVGGESPASDVKEESQQQAEQHHPDNAAFVGRQTEEADQEAENDLKDTFQTSNDERAQTGGAAPVQDGNRVEQQQPPRGDAEVRTPEPEEESQENSRSGHEDENAFQQELDFCREENAFCEKEAGKTQKELRISPVLTADLSQRRDTDTPTQIKTDILRPDSFDSFCFSALDSPPPPPPPPPPHPDTIFAPSLETDSVCSSPPKCDTAAVETDSPPFHPDSCEESDRLSSFLPVVPLSSTPLPPPPEDDAPPHFSPSVAHKQKVQSPKTLRDVVNRIRKHTAPDSESEEDEASESWDPESETFSCPDVVVEVKSRNVVSDESEERLLRDGAEMELMRRDEETLSCSSTNSHSSEDTVIVADDETTKMEKNGEKPDTTDGETSCSSEEETSSEESEAAERPGMETESL